MNSTKTSIKHQNHSLPGGPGHPGTNTTPTPAHRQPKPAPDLAAIRTTAREYANPVDYKHPYASMDRFADLLALRYDANRTRHAYYRQMRLVHEHFKIDPAGVIEEQLRDYFLFVKLKKHWKPKSIRQALAAALPMERAVGAGRARLSQRAGRRAL